MNQRRSIVADIIIDVSLAILAFGLIFYGVSVIREIIREYRWRASIVIPDPADTEVWAVLAEARRITQEAADATE
jgi:hypothetical protein